MSNPLIEIADAFDDNALDDDARKHWGKDDEHENDTDPADIVLYSGRGGRELLTLKDCLDAREMQRDIDSRRAVTYFKNLTEASVNAHEKLKDFLDDGRSNGNFPSAEKVIRYCEHALRTALKGDT